MVNGFWRSREVFNTFNRVFNSPDPDIFTLSTQIGEIFNENRRKKRIYVPYSTPKGADEMDGENNKNAPAATPVDKTEVTLSSDCVYDAGFIQVMSDRVRLPNGKESGRTYVKHPGGVCVAAIDAEGSVAFVRQYRYAMAQEVLELPAGKIDEGESPEDCGRRELLEETGMTAEKFIPLGVMYPTPGYSNEGIYMFLAENAIHGQAKPDEDSRLWQRKSEIFLSRPNHQLTALL